MEGGCPDERRKVYCDIYTLANCPFTIFKAAVWRKDKIPSATDSRFAKVCRGALPGDLDLRPLQGIDLALPIYQTPAQYELQTWGNQDEKVSSDINSEGNFYFRYVICINHSMNQPAEALNAHVFLFAEHSYTCLFVYILIFKKMFLFRQNGPFHAVFTALRSSVCLANLFSFLFSGI